VSISIIILFFLPYVESLKSVSDLLVVSIPALVLAGLTALVSFISYLWIPKKSLFAIGMIIYLLLATTVATLVVSSGGASSPFLELWTLTAVFAAVFGVWGLVPMLAGVGLFAGFEYLGGTLTLEVMALIALAGFAPLVASIILWHRKAGNSESDNSDRAYRNLANELTQVATKSEVVINAIGDGVLAVDAMGVIQLINPAAQRIIGWGKQDALALSYKSVLHLTDSKGNDLDQTVDPIQQVLNNNQQIRTNDFTIVTSSSKKLLASLVISPIGDTGSGAIVVFRDITKEKAEEREQAEFISTASHEMRTPVASIEGYLGLALNPATAQIDEKARDFIMKAHESAQHLGRLFQDLLDVSKATDGRLSNNPKVVDVLMFTHDILQGLEQKALDKGLRLVFQPIPNDTQRHVTPVYSVYLDNDHIREIVNNLVENAIKYTPAGQVVVNVTGNDDKVVISIKDSGIGIPAEDMPHLFQKFYRVDNVDTREIGGTGLGLFLCRRLAETLGGRIWAESEYKKGSTFYVELPRIDNQEAVRIAEQTAQAEQVQAAQAAIVQPVAAFVTPAQTLEPSAQPVQPAQSVPRGQSLTPEQIASYVAKQKALIQQQYGTEQSEPQQPVSSPQPTVPVATSQVANTVIQQPAVSLAPRTASVSIPVRDSNTQQ